MRNILGDNNKNFNQLNNKIIKIQNSIESNTKISSTKSVSSSNTINSEYIRFIKNTNIWQAGANSSYSFYIDRVYGDRNTFYISNEKNIGIGTSNPKYKLSVNGSLNVNNAFIVDSNIEINYDVIINRNLLIRGFQTNTATLTINGDTMMDNIKVTGSSYFNGPVNINLINLFNRINNVLSIYDNRSILIDKHVSLKIYYSDDNSIYSDIQLNTTTLSIINTTGDIILTTSKTQPSIILKQYNSVVFTGMITFLSDINIKGSGIFTSLKTYNIFPVENILVINGSKIYVGNNNTAINLNGSDLYVNSSNIKIKNNIIDLNNANNIGASAGINILSNIGTGYIKTSEDASQFYIKAPCGNKGYILSTNLNHDLYISNSSYLNEVTISSNLYVSGCSTFNSILSNDLYISTNSYLNEVTISSNLYVSSNSTFNSILSNDLYISNSSYLNEVTISSNLYVSGCSTLTCVTLYSIIALLPEYASNDDAEINGLPINALYKCNEYIKIRC